MTVGSRAVAVRGAMVVLVGLLVVPGLGGCKRTALRADDERSQFTRYDRTRNADAAPFIEDEYGRRTPNLRARLLVKD
jgi:hypothetical protein